jgi:glucosamine-6-phosphate deaminase
MLLRVFDDRVSLGHAAAAQAASAIRRAISEQGRARIVGASAASQFEFLEALTASPDIDWEKVELFHLDEYIGLPMTHPASFCKFLQDRLIAKTGIRKYHLLDGSQEPAELIRSVGNAIAASPIDVAFLGIGENGPIAFNEPPAAFENEDWFENLDTVPKHAISISVRQVLKAKEILAVVPGPRKAQAIKSCFDGPISPMAPSSILRNHSNATVYLDRQSSALLTPATLTALTASA